MVRAILTLQPAADTDQEELDELTAQLRERLLDEIDLDSADLVASESVPAMAKPGEVLTIGTLTITLSPIMLKYVVQLIQTWISHRPVRSVRLTLGKDSIEVIDPRNTDQRQLIKAFIERHTTE
jgi:hypothetical protein